jgi:hypothetical protein
MAMQGAFVVWYCTTRQTIRVVPDQCLWLSMHDTVSDDCLSVVVGVCDLRLVPGSRLQSPAVLVEDTSKQVLRPCISLYEVLLKPHGFETQQQA